MRIGIMGLGRIGAFHAETLAGLDGVDSLVSPTRWLHEHRPVRLDEVRK
ncbi:hypothetical protein ACFVYV_47530 [Streptomyces mirabilis]|nr:MULTISPECIES: hypothetical protein [Streptomyces]SOE53484.1 hypothetical protein SAMN05446589_0533 [Streptomyces sp. OV198]